MFSKLLTKYLENVDFPTFLCPLIIEIGGKASIKKKLSYKYNKFN
jgi:hypothetical protein